MDAPKMNSRDSNTFWLQIIKTVQEEDPWKRQQKEIRDLMENWKSSIQFCSCVFLSFWRIWRENWLQFLVNCDSDQKFVTIKNLYFQLITSLIMN